MAIISGFEVLLSGLIPPLPLPLVAQGYFLQISNASGSDQTVSLTYYESSNFTNATVDDFNILAANYIDGTGAANAYPTATFIQNSGFKDIVIPNNETFVFGLQAVPMPASGLADTHPAKSRNPKLFVAPKALVLPPFGIQWHGYVALSCTTATSGATAYIYPTTRGIFFDPIVEDTLGQTTDVVTLGLTTGQTYSPVPTVSGTAFLDLST